MVAGGFSGSANDSLALDPPSLPLSGGALDAGAGAAPSAPRLRYQRAHATLHLAPLATRLRA